MSMSFSTSEGHIFIIYRLNPFKIIMKKAYRIHEGFAEPHIKANTSIQGVPSELCFLCSIYVFS